MRTLHLTFKRRKCTAIGVFAMLVFASGAVGSQCPSEPPLQNNDATGSVACPCFVSGEQVGVILQAPPSH